MNFIVEDEFWDIFPKARIGIIICNDIDNSDEDEEKYQELLYNAQEDAMKFLGAAEFSQNNVINEWRQAFQQFKTKKGARSSIEALLKRVSKGDDLPTINPLVDLYNCISLKYGLPCGSEDISKFEGNLRLTVANGSEDFVTLGNDKSEPPCENEIIYKDDSGAVCRCWNWREAIRTMITNETKDAFICLEIVDDSKLGILKEAINELSKLIQKNLGGTSKSFILDIDNNRVKIAN